MGKYWTYAGHTEYLTQGFSVEDRRRGIDRLNRRMVWAEMELFCLRHFGMDASDFLWLWNFQTVGQQRRYLDELQRNYRRFGIRDALLLDPHNPDACVAKLSEWTPARC